MEIWDHLHSNGNKLTLFQHLISGYCATGNVPTTSHGWVVFHFALIAPYNGVQFPCCTRENRGSETVSDLPAVARLLSNRAGI